MVSRGRNRRAAGKLRPAATEAPDVLDGVRRRHASADGRCPRGRPRPGTPRPPPRCAASSQPSSGAIAAATRRAATPSGAATSRAAVSPSRVRRSSASPTVRACSWRAAWTTSASRSGGRPGLVDDRLGELPALGGDREHVVGEVAVAAGQLRVGGARARPRPAAGPRAATDWPSGISWVRQGASRASRSTSRSTVCLAIRRHVVSLPPVIVIMPLEVS